jgi:pyruvate/2-oxoglutarate/acetoin dehydrogenase E1 component
MKYAEELKRAMTWLGEKPDTFFLGQAVTYDGTAMTTTLTGVSKDKMLEMPVNEDMQLGISLGMSLNGRVPISIFPRWNFLLLASNQLVNHIDKLNDMSNGLYKSKIIIRTSIGSQFPLNPSYQHIDDFTDGFRLLCKNVEILRLHDPREIFVSYKYAYERTDNRSTILVEYGDYYNTK